MMLIDRNIFKEIAPRAKRFVELHRMLELYMPKYKIDTPERISAFLSQLYHESSGFRHMEENLNYSKRALQATFGKYFKNNRDVYNYVRSPEKLANLVYANRMGNGDVESGDGWKYRGRGYIQLTGKYNYQEFSDYKGMTLDDVIEYLSTVEGAVDSACWFWDVNRLNQLADERDIRKITKRINGGYNGLEERQAQYQVVYDLVSKYTQYEESKERKDSIFAGDVNVVLKFGDRNPEVGNMQRALGIKVDNNFGYETRRYLRRFQRGNRLPIDGVAGKLTLTKLYSGL
jgi:putative chitinase